MNHDANTDRRMKELRVKQQRDALGIKSTDRDRHFHQSESAAATTSAYHARTGDSTESWGVAGKLFLAGAAIGSVVLMRSLFKGTAPSSASRYAQLHQMAQGAKQTTTAHTASPSWTAASSHHSTSHSTSSNSSSHSSSYTHAKSNYRAPPNSGSNGQAHHAEGSAGFEAQWERMKSDYARFEEFQERARARAREGGSSSDNNGDAEFEMGRDQARADYIQSKWATKKRRQKVVRYKTWRNDDGELETDEHDAKMEGEEALFLEKFSAFKSMQRQLATQPKYVKARVLLFGDAQSTSISKPGAAPAAPMPSPSNGDSIFATNSTSAGSAFPVLTSNAVRMAYFTRAKECHPDVDGGDKEKFQQLTEAYELLIDTLEAIEKKPTGTHSSS